MDTAQGLTAIVDRIPIALGLIDRTGRIVGRAGNAAYVYRGVIPSGDETQRSRWIVTDDMGALVHPAHWPSKRALLGEVDFKGVLGRYQCGEDQLFRVIAVPVANPASDIAVLSLIRRLDRAGPVVAERQMLLEERLIEALARAASHTDLDGIEYRFDAPASR